jgi:hypothetical protein
MENPTRFNSNRRPWAVQLALTTGRASLLVGLLLWGLRCPDGAFALPGNLYVDGATGVDAGDCHTATAPCQTIGYAIGMAGSGEAVLVAAGTYNENLEVRGKDITVRGGYSISGTQWLAGTGTTSVDGGQAGRAFLIHDASNVTLEDVTITGGIAPEEACWGGGVQVTNGSATLRRTIVRGNQALCTTGQTGGGSGAGLSVNADEGPASLFIEDSFILDNLAGDHGSAVAMDHVHVVLTNVVIAGNNYHQLAVHMSDFTLVNSTIADNAADGNPILDFGSASSITVLNSIIWNSGSIACGGGDGACDITYSDIEGGWPGTGNIDEAPLFVGGGNYRLQRGSLCVDAGTNTGAPDHDLDQRQRPQDGDGDGTAAVDMGAYEFRLYRTYLPHTLNDFGA